MALSSAYKRTEVWYRAIILLGLALRLCLVVFQYQSDPIDLSGFKTSDSFSYGLPFVNLAETGVYTFDASHPDARFGRLPGYPLFWHLHYLLFGGHWAYLAVAISQAVIDTLSIALLMGIARLLFREWFTVMVIGAAYAFNPFFIHWTPITGTETLGVFLSLLFVGRLLRSRGSVTDYIWMGVLGALAFYVRSYLALLMVIPVCYFGLKRYANWFRGLSFMSLAFILLYSAWPIRNYLISGQLIFVKTANAGYHRYAPDVSECRNYLFTWTTDLDYYMDEVFDKSGEFDLPQEAIPNGYAKEDVKRTIVRAFVCGSGFRFWNHEGIHRDDNCDDEVAGEFRAYRQALFKQDPLRAHLKVPLLNLKKIFFKNARVERPDSSLDKVLFFFRTTLLLVGWLGLLIGLARRLPAMWSLAVFVGLIYILIAYAIRQVEMRYLLQADALLLIPMGLVLDQLSFGRKKKTSVQSAS